MKKLKKLLSAVLAGTIIMQAMSLVQVQASSDVPLNTTYTVPVSTDVDYNMNIGWKFLKPNYEELKNPNTQETGVGYWSYDDSMEYIKQKYGGGEKNFYDVDFDDSTWETVSVPHTYNDDDIFDSYINGSGDAVERGLGFYRKHFTLDEKHNGQKIFVEFEGIRQSAYVWVNGNPVGIYQLGVNPFGFDITEYVNYGGDNIIAVANDSSGGGNAAWGFQNESKPESPWGASDGVQVQWNSAGFNPAIGGLSRNVILHTKNTVYQTLPLYSNLKTTGTYVYGSNFDIEEKSATINVESEVRNESDADADLMLEVAVVDKDGKLQWKFETTEVTKVPVAADKGEAFLTVTAADAYVWEDEFLKLSEKEQEAIVDGDTSIGPVPEPTETDTVEVRKINVSATVSGIRFWSPDDPYLYDVYTVLKDTEGNILDVTETSTGFRKSEVKGGTDDAGVYINDKYYYLKGYAQRATNEWAAIGVSTDWLDDYDMALMRESNANHVRWMHIAAQPSDIRACDKYGIVVTQPAGDGEYDTKGRRWDQRVETMRDTIIYFRNNPSIVFWECGNNKVTAAHMQEMTDMRKLLDPNGGRVMGCRALGGETEDDKRGVENSEYIATMLGRAIEDDAGLRSWARDAIEKRAIMESEYYREEAPRRVWDDYSAPWYDYVHNPTRKEGTDAWDLTSEDFVIGSVAAYNHYYSNRVHSNSSRQTYSGAAMLCWTDSNQHGRNINTENARMSGRTDPVRIKKQSFFATQVMQSEDPAVHVVGHWNYSNNPDDYPSHLDPTKKTVYVVASNVKYVELFIDGVSQGKCVSPTDGFLYTFKDIDVTKTGGYIEAVGYNTKGEALASHKIETAGEAAEIRLTPRTGPQGFLADGSDVAFFDVEIVDSEGRVVPDVYTKLELSITGDAVLKGGYNSGTAPWVDGKADLSVAYPNHMLNTDPTTVYTECGTNRIFVRAGFEPGDITVTVTAPDLGLSAVSTLETTEVKVTGGLTESKQQTVINANIEPRPEKETPKQVAMLPLIGFSMITFGEGGNASIYEDIDTRQYITIYVNGEKVEGLTSYMMAGSVFGDLEMFVKAIGAEATLPDEGADLNTAQITVTKGDKIMRLKGSKLYDENGDEIKTINQISEWIDGKLYVELSEVSTQLDLTDDDITKDMTEYHVWTIDDIDYSFTLDTTGLTAEDFNTSDYTSVNSVVSIKADSKFIETDGVKLTKNNAKIKIVPKADGKIKITYSGGEAILPDYENRKGGETAVVSDVAIPVIKGTAYYLQGHSSSAAKITQIVFEQAAE